MKKRVFISRGLKADSIFKLEMQKAGFEVEGMSLLDFELVPFDSLPTVDWIFFYSQKGVQFFFKHLAATQQILPAKIQLAGFGKKTAEVIESFGQKCHFAGTGVADTTAPQFLKLIKNKKVLFPRAEKSQRSVQQLLDNQSDTIDLIVYKNFPKGDFKIQQPDYLVFTSPMNAEVYFQKYKRKQGQKVFSIGKTTAQKLHNLGIEEVVFPANPTEENLVKVLLSNL